MTITDGVRSVSLAESSATKVVQNTSVLLIGRIGSALIGGASSVLLVRCLGSEQFGEFSSLYAFVALFAWLATLGIEPVLTREAARRREGAGSIIATGIALCSIFAIVATVLVILLASHLGFRGKLQVLVVFAAIELLGFGPPRLAGAIFQVDLKQWYGTGINIARQILWLLIILLLAKTKASLTSIVLGRLSTAFAETILILVLSARFLKPPRRIIVQDFGLYLRACAPIALSTLLAGIYLRIDQVMLHNLASDSVLGFYSAAVKVSELFEMLPAALLSSLFPILAVAANNNQRMAVHMDRVFRYVMAAAGLLCTLISVGAGLIVRVLYGPEFDTSAHLLGILRYSNCESSSGEKSAKLSAVSHNRRGRRQHPAKFHLDSALRCCGLRVGNFNKLYSCLDGCPFGIHRHSRYGMGRIAEGDTCGVGVVRGSSYRWQSTVYANFARGHCSGSLRSWLELHGNNQAG